MMYRLAICLTLIFCSPLSAQSMPVRSGEHDGFTRFTVGISKGASWSIEADDAQARLRVEGIDVKLGWFASSIQVGIPTLSNVWYLFVGKESSSLITICALRK